jgi:hypothetical protein
MARALGIVKDELLKSAVKVDSEVANYVAH